MSTSKEASMVGVHVLKSNQVRVMLVGGNAIGLAHFDMTPEQARRHALRLLQTCELAEGKPPVNA